MEDKLRALRKIAEQMVSNQPREKPFFEEDIETVVHELYVHQAELEIQNETLRKTQIELEAERAKYSDLFDFAPVGYLTTDRLDRILEVNLAAADMMGVARKSLYDKPFSRYFTPESAEIYHHHKNAVYKTGDRQVSEMALRTKDGGPLFVHVESELVCNPVGKPVAMRTAMTDVSRRKQLEIASEETKTLLAETLHRTKNNLSVISYLLMANAESAGSQDAKCVLRETANRIKSLSLIQGMLFKSENPTRINLDRYLRDLAQAAFSSLKGEDMRATLSLDLDFRKTSSETAVYCGLLLNEIITNAMKYAFSDVGEGVFHVILRAGKTGEIELRAGDNGVGLVGGFNPEKGGFGFRLIHTFVKQLRGVMEVKTNGGTEYIIRFNPDVYTPRQSGKPAAAPGRPAPSESAPT